MLASYGNKSLKVGLSIQKSQVISVVQMYLLWLNTTKEHSQSVTDGNILAVAAPAIPTALVSRGAVGKQTVRGTWEWEGYHETFLSSLVHNM